MDPISKTHGSGRPKGLTRQQSEQRKQKIYALALRGFSESEIAQSLGMNQSNVSRALRGIRKRNARWFWSNLDMTDRLQNLFKFHYDSIWESVRESWLVYHNTPLEKSEAKATLLARVQNGLALCSKLVGLGLPDLDTLALQTEMIGVNREMEEIKQKIREKEQLEKVRPLSSFSPGPSDHNDKA